MALVGWSTLVPGDLHSDDINCSFQCFAPYRQMISLVCLIMFAIFAFVLLLMMYKMLEVSRLG